MRAHVFAVAALLLTAGSVLATPSAEAALCETTNDPLVDHYAACAENRAGDAYDLVTTTLCEDVWSVFCILR